MTTIKTLAASALVLATASCGVSTPAAAKTVCKPRAEMVEILSRKFSEHQRAFGLQNDRRVLELYASDSGTWTAILSMPNGKSCVVAAGEAWTVLPPVPSGEPT